MKAKATITITARIQATDTPRMAAAIETLINNLNLADIELLAKASGKPMIKTMALNELRKHV